MGILSAEEFRRVPARIIIARLGLERNMEARI
jgi:hypothetical protein